MTANKIIIHRMEKIEETFYNKKALQRGLYKIFISSDDRP